MIDWNANTWTPGARVKYHDSRPPAYLAVTSGLYWYSGLGCGHLFRADGTMLWCSPQEGAAEARRLGLGFDYVDSFDRCPRTISVRD